MYVMMPVRKYWLSVGRSTRHGFFSASSAEIAAISSMRLLVVSPSPPLSSFSRSPKVRIAPPPPRPGPSIIARAFDFLMKAQFSRIFARVLRPHHCARRYVEPVDQPRQQKTHRGAAREQRQLLPFFQRKRPRLDVAREQRAAFCNVVGMIVLETPGIEADGDVVGQRVGASEIKIDQPGQPVAE